MPYKRKKYRQIADDNRLIVMGLVVLALLLSVSLIRVVTKTNLANKTFEDMRADNEQLKKEIDELGKELESTSSVSYLEKQLRDGLGLSKPGEVVLVMPEREEVVKHAPFDLEPVQEKEKSNWQKWIDMFI